MNDKLIEETITETMKEWVLQNDKRWLVKYNDLRDMLVKATKGLVQSATTTIEPQQRDMPVKPVSNECGIWCPNCGAHLEGPKKSEGYLKGRAYPCSCHKCSTAGKDPSYGSIMILCSKCGNKRCPHATDHEVDCTGSNEPGQKGSVYQ